MARNKDMGLTPDERAQVRRYAEDLGDEELVDFAASEAYQAAVHSDRSAEASAVLYERMRADGSAIVIGEGDWNAEMKGGTYYVWPEKSLQDVRALLIEAGEDVGKHLNDSQGYEFTSTRAAKEMVQVLDDMDFPWREYIDEGGEVKPVNSERLISWLQKLGSRASHITWEKHASPATSVTFVKKGSER